MLDDNFKPHFGDFGFAKIGNKSVEKLGTPEYGSPEMFSTQSRGPFSFEIDIFSLGVVFYEILNSSEMNTLTASNNFSMNLGHQKPFSKNDFPGFEWMINMVTQNPSKRMSIIDVYKNLSNSNLKKEDNIQMDKFKPENVIYKQYLGQKPLNDVMINKKSPFQYEHFQVKKKKVLPVNESHQKYNRGFQQHINDSDKKEFVSFPKIQKRNTFIFNDNKDLIKKNKLDNDRNNVNMDPKKKSKDDFNAIKEKKYTQPGFELPKINNQLQQLNRKEIFRRKNFESNFELGRILI